MKSISYTFYVTDLQLEPRIVDLRSDRAGPLSKILKTTVGQPGDSSLAAVNAAIDLYKSEWDPNRSGLKLPGNFYLSQFA